MDVNEYFRKVYTIAFRLAGDETKAADMALSAIKCVSSDVELSYKVPFDVLRDTAREVCRIFLSEAGDNSYILRISEKNNSKAGSFQNALMTLNPLRRAAVVWRDVLGFKIDDVSESDYSRQELYMELNKARRQIIEKTNDG